MVFPAFFRVPRVEAAALVQEGDASCFYHARKSAAAVCDQCGRFLCSLCQVDFLGQNWCPVCIESRRVGGKLETRRTLYDTMALQLATLPLLLWPFTLITAPSALYVVFRYWRAPGSLVPRTRARFYIALVLSVVQSGCWLWLIAFAVSRR